MAASKPKSLKILTLSEQMKTIGGVTKRKRFGTKNALDNPLALEWPVITPEDQQKITHLLEESCRSLKKMKIKPPWSEIKKHRSGAERKAFLCKFKEDFLGRQDAGALEREQEADAARTHLVLGFNATMRALENDCIAAIVVKRNVNPPFIAKTFLPGCGTKCIPVVPIPDLDSLLRAGDGLGLEHSCMALGLRPTVRERHNRFNALYMKMCAALSIEDDEGERDDSDDFKESENIMTVVEEEEDGDNNKSDIKVMMDAECEVNQKDIENDKNVEEEDGDRENKEKYKKSNKKEILDNKGGKHGEITSNEGNNKQGKFRVLSTTEIQSYLLKRSRQDRRVFMPGQQCEGMSLGKSPGNKKGKQTLDSSAGFGSDFISLEDGEAQFREDSEHRSNLGNAPLNRGNLNIPRFTQQQSDNGNANVFQLNQKELHNGKAYVPRFTQKDSNERMTPKPAQKEPDRETTNVPKFTQKDSNERTANWKIDFHTMLVMDKEGDESCRDATAVRTCDEERGIGSSLTNTGEGDRAVVKRGEWERKGKNNERDDDKNNDGKGVDTLHVHKDGGNRKTKMEEGDGTKKKNVKRKVKACEYIPAQMKRFKANPHRKK